MKIAKDHNEMGRYLVLQLDFSQVSADGDVMANFYDYINRAVLGFSDKYCKAGLLNDPIDINPEDSWSTIHGLFLCPPPAPGSLTYVRLPGVGGWHSSLLLQAALQVPVELYSQV
jgi:hypothetical protein